MSKVVYLNRMRCQGVARDIPESGSPKPWGELVVGVLLSLAFIGGVVWYASTHVNVN